MGMTHSRRHTEPSTWTNITVVGGPALSSEGAARWQDYERLRAEETARRGGTAETWLEERRRCAAAERQRVTTGRAKMAQREAKAKAHEAAGEERAARFAATHARQQQESGPRGVGPRVAHPGGVITTNKAYATAKFFERKGNAGGGCEGAEGRKRVRWEDAEGEEEAKRVRAALAPTARRVSAPAAAAQAPAPTATAQRREGASSSKTGAAASSETAGAASTPAAKKRQREEGEQTGQTATAAAAAEAQSDTGQTGAATDGDGGAARAAAGAEPAAKKKKGRGRSKSGIQRKKARREAEAATQRGTPEANVQ